MVVWLFDSYLAINDVRLISLTGGCNSRIGSQQSFAEAIRYFLPDCFICAADACDSHYEGWNWYYYNCSDFRSRTIIFTIWKFLYSILSQLSTAALRGALFRGDYYSYLWGIGVGWLWRAEGTIAVGVTSLAFLKADSATGSSTRALDRTVLARGSFN